MRAWPLWAAVWIGWRQMLPLRRSSARKALEGGLVVLVVVVAGAQVWHGGVGRGNASVGAGFGGMRG